MPPREGTPRTADDLSRFRPALTTPAPCEAGLDSDEEPVKFREPGLSGAGSGHDLTRITTGLLAKYREKSAFLGLFEEQRSQASCAAGAPGDNRISQICDDLGYCRS